MTTATTAPATPTPAPRQTNWWRIAFVAIAFAIAIRIAFHVPITVSVTAIAVAVMAQALYNLLPQEFALLRKWLGVAIGCIVGVSIFLILRYIAAKYLGIYPIQTVSAIRQAHGLKGIAGGTNVPSPVLFEVLFAIVFGGLAIAWVKGHRFLVSAIFLLALIVVTLEVSFKEYHDTFMNRDETAHELATKGVVGTIKGTVPKELLSDNTSAPATTNAATAASTTTVVKVGCVTTPYRFADYPDGEIVHTISSHDFRVYPKGGCVHTYPKKGVEYIDCPGVDVPKDQGTTSYGPGTWRWRAKDEAALGVDVCE